MPTGATTVRGTSVKMLLLGVNALVLLVPIMVFLSLRLYQSQLVRQTETKLIAESVLIGEAFRSALLKERGRAEDQTGRIRPRSAQDERFAPINPMLGDDYELLPRVAEPKAHCRPQDSPAWRAGARIKPLIDRAQVFNLSSARVLDEQACVVAASGTWLGAQLKDLPEVQGALSGRYTAVARERLSDEPKPSILSISRRGDVRVFCATPVLEDDRVLGVVWMSRTAMDPYKAAWLSRKPLLTALGLSVLLTLAVSLYLSRRITRPLAQITSAASAIARGGQATTLSPTGVLPAEIDDLTRALSTMKAQLSDRADYISDFAANVSHELKSPITSIKGASELLNEEGDRMPAEQRQRFVNNMAADAARMERLVNRLLELARIQSAPEQSAQLELKPFLERLLADFEGRVELDGKQAPQSMDINVDHLESALRNLIQNAVRHGPDHPVQLRVSTSTAGVVFEVKDRGPGISQANQARIFDRFFTTHRDSGGTGLGLAIVAAVARTRSGSIDCQSGPEGTTFTLVV